MQRRALKLTISNWSRVDFFWDPRRIWRALFHSTISHPETILRGFFILLWICWMSFLYIIALFSLNNVDREAIFRNRAFSLSSAIAFQVRFCIAFESMWVLHVSICVICFGLRCAECMWWFNFEFYGKPYCSERLCVKSEASLWKLWLETRDLVLKKAGRRALK